VNVGFAPSGPKSSGRSVKRSIGVRSRWAQSHCSTSLPRRSAIGLHATRSISSIRRSSRARRVFVSGAARSCPSSCLPAVPKTRCGRHRSKGCQIVGRFRIDAGDGGAQFEGRSTETPDKASALPAVLPACGGSPSSADAVASSGRDMGSCPHLGLQRARNACRARLIGNPRDPLHTLRSSSSAAPRVRARLAGQSLPMLPSRPRLGGMCGPCGMPGHHPPRCFLRPVRGAFVELPERPVVFIRERTIGPVRRAHRGRARGTVERG